MKGGNVKYSSRFVYNKNLTGTKSKAARSRFSWNDVFGYATDLSANETVSHDIGGMKINSVTSYHRMLLRASPVHTKK